MGYQIKTVCDTSGVTWSKSVMYKAEIQLQILSKYKDLYTCMRPWQIQGSPIRKNKNFALKPKFWRENGEIG